MDRDDEWFEILEEYLDVMSSWNMLPLDHEDASHAVISSLAMEEACSQLSK